MAKQTTVRLPGELADQAEAVARVKGTSVNALIIDSLAAEIQRVRDDKDFTARARELLKRDQELLDRLPRWRRRGFRRCRASCPWARSACGSGRLVRSSGPLPRTSGSARGSGGGAAEALGARRGCARRCRAGSWWTRLRRSAECAG